MLITAKSRVQMEMFAHFLCFLASLCPQFGSTLDTLTVSGAATNDTSLLWDVLQGLTSLTRPVCMAMEGSDLESLVRLVNVLKGEKLQDIGAFLQTLLRNQVSV